MALNVYERELARRNLYDFTQITKPNFIPNWFHEKYYSKLEAFSRGDIKKLMVFVPPQHGKECAHSTPVLTTNGWTTHGELKVGDYVFGRDGKPVRVIALHAECMSEYNVQFTDGSVIQCHGKHEWIVFDRRTHGAQEKRLETEEMFNSGVWLGPRGRGGRGRYQIDANVPVDFHDADLPIHPYVLGAWLGDGTSTSNCITHHADDTETIEKILSLGYEITTQNVHKGTGAIRTGFTLLYKQLRAANLNDNKHIPYCYFTASIEQRLELLAGLIDTDGYVYHKNGRVTFSNINKRLIDDVNKLVISLGWRTSISQFHPVTSTSGIIGKNIVYQLCFNPDTTIPTVIERKRLVNINPVKRRRAIVSITKAENPEMGRCIQVEGGIYLVGETLIPTHNSEGSTRRLPAKMIGMNPNLKMGIACYAASKAKKFGREIKRILMSPEYQEIYPGLKLSDGKNDGYQNAAQEFEIVGHEGSIKLDGYTGSWTGDPIDCFILDDLYKSRFDALSDSTNKRVIDFYNSVAEARLHNDSQVLIVFTRWSPLDLAGYLLKSEPEEWQVVVYPALKIGEPTEDDPRKHGEALLPFKHNQAKLLRTQKRDKIVFDSLYQQNPKPAEGLLFPIEDIRFYDPAQIDMSSGQFVYSQMDAADEGGDSYAAPIAVLIENAVYVPEVIFSTEGVEVTEPRTIDMVRRWRINAAQFEGNGGWVAMGKSIRRILERVLPDCEYRIIKNTVNKDTRIQAEAGFIKQYFYFRSDYKEIPEYERFLEELVGYLRAGSNKHDDAPDVLAGVSKYFRTFFQHVFYSEEEVEEIEEAL